MCLKPEEYALGILQALIILEDFSMAPQAWHPKAQILAHWPGAHLGLRRLRPTLTLGVLGLCSVPESDVSALQCARLRRFDPGGRQAVGQLSEVHSTRVNFGEVHSTRVNFVSREQALLRPELQPASPTSTGPGARSDPGSSGVKG